MTFQSWFSTSPFLYSSLYLKPADMEKVIFIWIFSRILFQCSFSAITISLNFLFHSAFHCIQHWLMIVFFSLFLIPHRDIIKSFIFYFSCFHFLFPFISVTIIIMALFGNNIKVPSPSPRIMSPMGFAVHRQARHIASVMDENSIYGDETNDGYDGSYIRPVPIWLCVFLVIGYIIGGAFLFTAWEKWEFLDAAYFCFITLTTIGKLNENFTAWLLIMHFL